MCFFLLITGSVILLYIGCKEDDGDGNSQSSESSERSETSETDEGTAEKPVRTLTLKEDDSDSTRGDRDTSLDQTGSQVPFHAEKGDRLAEKWLIPLEPEDFEIGVLEEESEMGRSMYTFFMDFAEGSIQEEYIHPEWENRIMTIFKSLENGAEIPRGVRIGDFILEGNTIFFPLRFINEVSSAEGIVYLQKHEGEWLITDIQINPIEARDRTGKDGKFQPSMYQWMGE